MNIPCKYNPDFILFDDGRMFSTKSNIFLKTRTRRHGYLAYLFRDITQNNTIKTTFSNKINRVYIRKIGIKRAFSIHRLLAEHFIPNPNNYKEINHKNGIKTDNRIENLEWCTHSYNCKHAITTGLHKPLIGEKHIRAKLKEYQVIEIKKLLKYPHNKNEIAKKFNISVRSIYAISSKQNWAHLPN
jgi:DNA invertase Pin-like site-specific DNA recombinase